MTNAAPAPATIQAAQPPLLLPPRSEKSELLEDEIKQSKVGEEQLEFKDDINLSKAEVLLILHESCLNKIESLTVKTVSAKLKHLDDDWDCCDYETKKLLVDLTGCKFSFINCSQIAPKFP